MTCVSQRCLTREFDTISLRQSAKICRRVSDHAMGSSARNFSRCSCRVSCVFRSRWIARRHWRGARMSARSDICLVSARAASTLSLLSVCSFLSTPVSHSRCLSVCTVCDLEPPAPHPPRPCSPASALSLAGSRGSARRKRAERSRAPRPADGPIAPLPPPPLRPLLYAMPAAVKRAFRCPTCQRKFLKARPRSAMPHLTCQADHVTRHERTHTGERPFACDEPGW